MSLQDAERRAEQLNPESPEFDEQAAELVALRILYRARAQEMKMSDKVCDDDEKARDAFYARFATTTDALVWMGQYLEDVDFGDSDVPIIAKLVHEGLSLPDAEFCAWLVREHKREMAGAAVERHAQRWAVEVPNE